FCLHKNRTWSCHYLLVQKTLVNDPIYGEMFYNGGASLTLTGGAILTSPGGGYQTANKVFMGAALGALAGGVIGSVIPGVGTGIGRIVGAVAGGVGGYIDAQK